MNLNLHGSDIPDGLTRRARSFISAHGVKVDIPAVEDHRQWRLDRGIPSAVIDLEGFAPVPEVRGLADTWWRGTDSLVAVYTGEYVASSWPRGRAAWIYSGPNTWGPRGGAEH